MIAQEVSTMRKNFIEICHGCNKEVITCNRHVKAKLGGRKEFTYFHNTCFQQYKRNHAHNVLWSEDIAPRN